MPPLTSTKEDQMRTSIILAAQQLFRQYGLHKVTMEDIARAMGKGKSSLYYYYKSKEEIFEAMLDREINDMLATISAAVAQASTPEEKLYAFLATRMREVRRKAALHGVLVGEVLRDMSFVYHIRQRCRQRESVLLKQLLVQDAATGHPNLNVQDFDVVVAVVLSGLHLVEEEMLATGADQPLEPAMHLLSRTLSLAMKA